MEDVHELVRDNEFHPVVEVGERSPVGGRAGVQRDAVGRHHVGKAVGEVAVVGEHDVDAARRRRTEGRGQQRVRPLRPVGQAGREGVEGIGVGDPEMLRVERAPILVGRHLGDGRSRREDGTCQNRREHERPCQVATAVATVVRDTAHTRLHRIMAAKANIWYRLGYAWENARPGPVREGRRQPDGSSPLGSGNGSEVAAARKRAGVMPWRSLLGDAGGLARRAVGRQARRVPVRDYFFQATLAGAGAALAARSLRMLLRDDAPSTDDHEHDPLQDLLRELLQGVSQGLALAILTGHLPRDRLLRVVCCSAAGYAAAPRGGLSRVMRPIAPAAIKAVSAVAPAGDRDRGLLEHVAFATAFVLLYRPGAAGAD